MNTRRSPRNQEILWRALGEPLSKPRQRTIAEEIDFERRAMAACRPGSPAYAVAVRRINNLLRRKASEPNANR